MGIEIERKFLLTNQTWREQVEGGAVMKQGYLGGSRCSVRVRIAGDQARLNIKSLDLGRTRQEYEYGIPLQDAERMLADLADGPLIEKTRHRVTVDGMTWEIDEFHGANQGLIVAEIELDHEQQDFTRPAWLGQEVTDDERYYNIRLARHPFRSWAS